MIYLTQFNLPGDAAEIHWIKEEKRTCFPTFYPFKIFPAMMLEQIDFEPITLFYGGNGSGKSTLINVIAEKLGAIRYADFNNAPFFHTFVDMCKATYYRRPYHTTVLSSDDVFEYVLNARSVNEHIDDKREALFEKYAEVKRQAQIDPEVTRFKGLDDYERWTEVREILSQRKSQSGYIRKRVEEDIALHSNGETAMRYFLDRIDEDGLYLLDEPENSLSVEYQIELAEYITATARATRSQFIIATHSPILLSMKGAVIYNLDDYPARETPWTELPNVRRYFDFFMEHKDEFQ